MESVIGDDGSGDGRRVVDQMMPMGIKDYVIAGMVVVIAMLGFYALIVSGESNVLSERIKTRDETIARKNDSLRFQKAWMERDKLDAQAKDAEYNRTMAAKPKYVTQIKYVPTGDKCADYEAIINEARVNR